MTTNLEHYMKNGAEYAVWRFMTCDCRKTALEVTCRGCPAHDICDDYFEDPRTREGAVQWLTYEWRPKRNTEGVLSYCSLDGCTGTDLYPLQVKLEPGTAVPEHSNVGDAGIDLRASRNHYILPGCTCMVGTGVHVAIPSGYFGLLCPRSGLAAGRGITLANTPGVIDSGYRGEVKAPLYNINRKDSPGVFIKEGERICQLILVPYSPVKCVVKEDLDDTERGDGGFGSTGYF